MRAPSSSLLRHWTWMDVRAVNTHTHTRVTRPAENSARIYLCLRHAVKVRIWWHAR